MAEWSIAAVLKTVVLRGTGGSNPSLSAKRFKSYKDLDLFFVPKNQSWRYFFDCPVRLRDTDNGLQESSATAGE